MQDVRLVMLTSARIDRNAVVLILASDAREIYTCRLANVKAISIVTALAIAGGVIDVHILDLEVLSAVDGEGLDWRVLDVEAGDCAYGTNQLSSLTLPLLVSLTIREIMGI